MEKAILFVKIVCSLSFFNLKSKSHTCVALLFYACLISSTAFAQGPPVWYENNAEGVTFELVPNVNANPNAAPLYYITDNVTAALTVSADKLFAGGGLGLNLSGQGVTIGVWDGGAVRFTHSEFDTGSGSKVLQIDLSDIVPTGLDNFHATHVTGTIGALGNEPFARGIAVGAQIEAYNWSGDMDEMAVFAANGGLLSNHSYGPIRGWYYYGVNDEWQWYGVLSINGEEDYLFGFYDEIAREWDLIASENPYYLPVKSAGNDRNDTPPSGLDSFVAWEGGVATLISDLPLPNADGNYDCLGHAAISKNVLTVGAVDDIEMGYVAATDVEMTTFSSWGPADDGRIKPDIVTNGLGLYSCTGGSDGDYSTYSGTSMAAPGATGVLALLQEHYANLHGGTYMLAATAKALVIHTADEAGSTEGPDYQFGWGLLNAERAAQTITDHVAAGDDVMIETTLSGDNSYEQTIYTDGTMPLYATLVWTDLPGAILPHTAADNPTPSLINDLDLRIIHTETEEEFMPYKLDAANPANAATTGDNIVDNVEKVWLATPAPGNYIVRVKSKGLDMGTQSFSLIVSGMGEEEPVVCEIIGGYEATGDYCLAPSSGTTFEFLNTSIGGATFEWYIDEMLFSTEEHTNYTFETAGDYTIKVRAIDELDPENCWDEYETSITILPYDLVADFTYNVNNLEGNFFSDVNTSLYAAQWSIDVVQVSTEQDMFHVFEAPGTYNICLRVTNECNTEGVTVCKDITVTEAEIACADADGVIWVTNVADAGEGSLRSAIICANETEGANEIKFNITGMPPFTIQPLSELPAITDTYTHIDAFSQSDFNLGDIVLDGSLLNGEEQGIRMINTTDAQICGLTIVNFPDEGVYAEGSVHTIIGGQGKGNVISGNGRLTGAFGEQILVAACTSTYIQGNRIGTNVAGDAVFSSDALGSSAGVYIWHSISTTIGGALSGYGNVISGNGGDGIFVDSCQVVAIYANLIGTDITGTYALTNGENGIKTRLCTNTTIGALEEGGNLISGNIDSGILIGEASDITQITGNKIGTDLSGVNAIGNGYKGIWIDNSTNTDIGSLSGVVVSNIIANNLTGIAMTNMSQTCTIGANSIFCNQEFGIYHEFDSNGNQPLPILTTANETTISGTASFGEFIHVYQNNNDGCMTESCQGKTYLGQVIADIDGLWTLNGTFEAGTAVTAIATAGNTSSAFADCMLVEAVIVESCLATDSLALVAVYTTMGGDSWLDKTGWLELPVADWFGVALSEDGCSVTELVLNNNNLVGEIPDLNLPNLQYLSLIGNNITGSIPEFSHLENLYSLTLYENQISGNLPLFTNSPNLQELSIQQNQITGSIPDWNLSELANLNLGDNQLSGAIPEFTYLSNLQGFYVYNNMLTGTLPYFTNVPNLRLFNVLSNQLEGEVPDWNLSQLDYLELAANQLTGSLPPFTHLANMTYFSAYENALNGTLPTFEYSPLITQIHLEDNQLSGTVPDFSSLGILQHLHLSLNHFTFAGMEENVLAAFPEFYYESQACIEITETDGVLSVSAGGTLSNNVYTWYKDGAFVAEVLGEESFTPSEPGVYTCSVINIVAIGLVLCSEEHDFNAVSCIDIDAEKAVLVEIYTSLNGDEWNNNTNWLDDAIPLSEWYGISISEDGCHVTGIVLNDNNLSGIVPDLSGLAFLENVSFENNSLTFAGMEEAVDFYNLSDAFVEFTYAPQACIEIFKSEDTGQFYVEAGGDMINNTYTWSKNGDALAPITGDNFFTPDGAANYTCTIENSKVPGLVLCTIAEDCSAIDATFSLDATAPCVGDMFNALVMNPTESAGYIWTINGVEVPGDLSLEHLFDASGDYEISLRAGDGFYYEEYTQTVAVGSHASSLEIPETLTICGGTGLSFEANITDLPTYIWDFGGDLVSTTALVEITTVGTYTLTAMDNCGNNFMASITVSEDDLSVNAGEDQVACGNEVTLEALASSSNGTDGLAYLWSNGESTAAIEVSDAGIYGVVVTATNGCTAYDEVEMILGEAVVIDLGEDVVTCEASIELDATLPGDNTYLWSNGASTPTITVTTPGTYTVWVEQADGCLGFAEKTITFNTPPVITALETAVVSCQTDYTLNVGIFDGATYEWSDGTSIIGTDPSLNVNTSGTYSVVVTDSNGCTATAESVVDLVDFPDVEATLGEDISVCETAYTLEIAEIPGALYLWSGGETGTSITFSASGVYTLWVVLADGCEASGFINIDLNAIDATINTGEVEVATCESTFELAGPISETATYTWSDSSGGIVGTDATLIVNESGTYNLLITEGDCTGSSEMIVNLNAVSVELGEDLITCNETEILDALIDGEATYVWSTGETTSSIEVTEGNTYSVSVTNTAGCMGTDEIAITFNALEVEILGGNVTGCATEYELAADQADLTYEWRFDDGTGEITLPETAQTIMATQTGTYFLRATNAEGCEGVSETTVTIVELPTVELGEDFSTCETEQILDAGEHPDASYLWSTGETTQTITVIGTGEYAVWILPNGFGDDCVAYDQITVTFEAGLEVTLPENPATCEATFPLDAGTFDSAIYTWYFDDGTGEVTLPDTSPTIETTTGGTYRVVVTSGACTGEASTTVTFNDSPEIALSSTITTCEESYTLDAGMGGASYVWSNGSTGQTLTVSESGVYWVAVSVGGFDCIGYAEVEVIFSEGILVEFAQEADATCADSYELAAPVSGETYEWTNGETTETINITETGTYAVIVTDINGCTGTDEIFIEMHDAPVFDFGADQNLCDESYELSALDFGFNETDFSFEWNTTETTASIVVNTGGYYELTVTDLNTGCTHTDGLEITLNEAAILTLPETASSCGEAIILDPGFIDGVSYLWSNEATTQTIEVTEAGIYSVWVVTPEGCSSFAQVEVSIYEAPSVDLGTDQTTCGEAVTLDAGEFAAHEWSTGETTQTIEVTESGEYFVIVTDENGCTATAESVIITINELPVVELGEDILTCDAVATLDAGTWAAYEWSTGETTQTIEVLEAGIYTVHITDENGCTASDEIIVEFETLEVDLGEAIVTCDASVILESSVTALSYLWSTGETGTSITVTESGIYSLWATSAGGCLGFHQIEVTILEAPVVDLGPDQSTCEESLVIHAGIVDGASYIWRFDDGTGEITLPDTTPEITVSLSGVYSVSVSNGVCENADQIVVTFSELALDLEESVFTCLEEFFLETGFTDVETVIQNLDSGDILASNVITLSGTYGVTITDDFGCTGYDEIEITFGTPTPVDLGEDISTCATAHELYAGYDDATIMWSTGEITPTITVTESGIYSAWVIVEGSCVGFDQITITFVEAPTVTLGDDISSCETVTIEAQTTATVAAYHWHKDGADLAETNATLTVTESGTYEVEITDENGCIALDEISIEILEEIAFDLGDDISTCETSIFIEVPAEYSIILITNPTTGETFEEPLFTQSGTYLFEVMGENGCTGSDEITLTFTETPAIDLGDNVEVCANSHELDAGVAGAIYLWSTGETTQTINVLESGTYSVWITIDGFECIGFDEIEVVLNTLPDVVIASDDVVTCNETVTIEAALLGEIGATLLWSTGETGTTITVETSGVYTVTALGDNGCTDTDEITVTITEPAAVDLGDDLEICADVHVLDAGAHPGATYLWNTGETTQTIEVTSSGVYDVWVLTGDDCAAFSEIQITLNALVVDLGDDLSVCDASTTLSISETLEDAIFIWSDGSTETTLTVTESGIYSVSVINGEGCVGSDEIEVMFNAIEVTLGTDVVTCETTHTLDAGEFVDATYEWLKDGTALSDITQTLTVTESGIYEVKVTNAAECTGTATVEVTLDAMHVDLGEDISSCSDVEILDAGEFIDATYGWYKDGVALSDITQTLTVTESGIYTVEVTNANGCVGTDEINVTITNLVIDLGSDITVCEADVTLDAGVEDVTYYWSTGEITKEITVTESGYYSVWVVAEVGCVPIFSGVFVTLNEPIAIDLGDDIATCESEYTICLDDYEGTWSTTEVATCITVVESGTYTVEVMDENGCMGIGEIAITFNEAPSTTLTDITTCEGSVVLDAGVTAPGAIFLWNTGETSATITVTEPGNYWVTVAATGFDCLAFAESNVTFAETPQVELGEDITTCATSVTLTAEAGEGLIYEWSTGATTESINVIAAGTYTVTVTDETTGCTATDSVSVEFSGAVVVDLGGDIETCLTEVVLDAGDFLDYVTVEYEWSTGETTKTIVVTSTGDYSVSVTADSCTGSDTKNVTIHSDIGVDIGTDVVECGTEHTITATVSGVDATAEIMYLWSNGETTESIIVTEDGEYSVVVTVAGLSCILQTSKTVTFSEPPVVDLGGDVNTCSDVVLDAGVEDATYLWNTGETTKTILVTEPGEYWVVVVVEESSCMGFDMVNVEYGGGPVVDLGDDILTCDIATEITGSLSEVVDDAVYTWSWNGEILEDQTGATIENPENGTYIVKVLSYGTCETTDTIEVFADDECVFPGDANYDGIANNYDLLAIGESFNTEGVIRPNATNDFEGQPCPVWDNNLADDTNNKHQDCNGSGKIDLDDVWVITQNYGAEHDGLSPIEDGYEMDLEVPATLVPDFAYEFDINLGSATAPLDGVYGIAFSIYYTPGLLDLDATSINFGNSFLGTLGEDMIAQYWLRDDNRIDIALTRIDQQNITAGGTLARFSTIMVIDDVGEGSEYTLEIGNVTLIGYGHEVLPVDGDFLSSTGGIIGDTDITPVEETVTTTIQGCVGEVLFLDAGDLDSYTWRKDGELLTGEHSRILAVQEAGEYTVEGMDGIIIAEFATLPNAPVVTQNCNELTAVSDAVSFQWYFNGILLVGETNATYEFTSFAPSAIGTYTVEARNEQGCMTETNFDVAIPNPPVSDFDIEVINNTIVVTNMSENADLYTWHFGDGNIVEGFEPTFTYEEAGEYMVTLMAVGACTFWDGMSLPVTISDVVPTGIETDTDNLEDLVQATLYPNPNNGTFTITLSNTADLDISLNLYDITGRSHYQKAFGKYHPSIEHQIQKDLVPGVYFLEIATDKGRLSKKVIIH